MTKPHAYSTLIESLLEGYFSDEEEEEGGGGGGDAPTLPHFSPSRVVRRGGDAWEHLMSDNVMRLPETKVKDMLLYSLEQGHVLVMYYYLRKKRPVCQDIKEEEAMISTVLDWLRNIKMRYEHQQ